MKRQLNIKVGRPPKGILALGLGIKLRKSNNVKYVGIM
jgi:hypothetical protein